ncbi:hypothetical protein [Streptomyces sp. NPDC050255]|uniref:hypothetical protein n=1 Tax=Streptomyces sp. NPDC050255 TaxID=3365606 RepID=UPI00379740DC
MPYAFHRTKGALVLDVLLPGQEGLFGRRPAGEDGHIGVDVEEPVAMLPASREGSRR